MSCSNFNTNGLYVALSVVLFPLLTVLKIKEQKSDFLFGDYSC
jgi:hypothetical protein